MKPSWEGLPYPGTLMIPTGQIKTKTKINNPPNNNNANKQKTKPLKVPSSDGWDPISSYPIGFDYKSQGRRKVRSTQCWAEDASDF